MHLEFSKEMDEILLDDSEIYSIEMDILLTEHLQPESFNVQENTTEIDTQSSLKETNILFNDLTNIAENNWQESVDYSLTLISYIYHA